MKDDKAKKEYSGKRNSLLRIAFGLLLSALLAFVLINSAFADDPAPKLSIDLYNLSYSESTYVLYAVSCTGIDRNTTEVELLFWNSPDANGYQKGSELYSSLSVGNVTVGGKKYAVFYSAGIAPKNLGDTIYCRAYAETASGAVYSNPVKYSALQYLVSLEKRQMSQADKNLALTLRNYGAAAQIRFGYHTDFLSSGTFCTLSLEGAHLEDGFSSGIYPENATVTLFANDSEKEFFIRWFDGDGTLLGTGQTLTLTLEQDTTVRAVRSSLGDSDDLEGITFSASAEPIHVPVFGTGTPITIEATLQLSSSFTGRGGVILGNYSSGSSVINLEVHTGGRVRLFFGESETKTYNVFFDVDIRGNTAKQIAVTIPEKGGTCRLYIDGILADEQTMPCDIPPVLDKLLLGGDYRNGNTQYFKGRIYSLAIFDGVRSASAIASDAQNALALDDPDLLRAYFFVANDTWKDYGPEEKDLYTGQKSGFSPSSISDRYSLTKTFFGVPLTYEAIIETDADVSNKKGCTIVGNYNDTYVPGITFRVYLDGRPSLCLRYDLEHQDQFMLPVSILGMGTVHVAFSIDETYVYGYLNGELLLTKAHCGYLPELSPYPFSVGGDNRTDNTWWFRNGAIYSINLFSECRTQEQILRDVNRIDTTDPTLMLSFDFEKSIVDQSSSKNQLVSYFYDDEFLDSDEYDFTFACVGDTQSLVKLHPEELHNIYDFILENKNNLKINRVIGLGDMTEDNTADQWELVSEEVFRLDGELPYTVIRGNHDHYARTPEAEATREQMFFDYFDNAVYRKQYDGSYNGTPAHTYTRFTVCGIPYLLLCLDYGPDDDVLAWASSVVESFPDDNVIVVTHAFLFHDGTTLDEHDICPPRRDVGFNNCDEMWDKFVSKHENIVLVLCGHDPSNEVVTSQLIGENGNIVTCCLIDPQHTDFYMEPAGLVALLHFSDGGSKITIEYYSTVKNQFYKTDNRIVVENVGGSMN